LILIGEIIPTSKYKNFHYPVVPMFQKFLIWIMKNSSLVNRVGLQNSPSSFNSNVSWVKSLVRPPDCLYKKIWTQSLFFHSAHISAPNFCDNPKPNPVLIQWNWETKSQLIYNIFWCGTSVSAMRFDFWLALWDQILYFVFEDPLDWLKMNSSLFIWGIFETLELQDNENFCILKWE